MKRLFPTLCLLALSLFQGTAQVTTQPLISWEEFVEEFLAEQTDDEESTGWESSLSDLLETYGHSPLNINTARRAELLQLPFLSEAQTDSILSYRGRKRGFLSLGELIFIPSLSYNDRRWLSLFTYCGENPQPSDTLRHKRARRGTHSLESRLDIPLYKRDGYKPKTKEELLENPNRIYLGNNLRHLVRYKFKNDLLRCGATFEKDAGEPFSNRGNYPYDYNSLYLHYVPDTSPWQFVVGDYNLQVGSGLLLGNAFWLGNTAVVTGSTKPKTILKGHSSTNESDFFRGAAVRFNSKRWQFLLFASYRHLDARLSDGKATSFITDGLHRTLRERERLHNLGSTTAGGRLAYGKGGWETGLNTFCTFYEYPLAPSPRNYNRYYLRGKNAAGFSADYRFSKSRWFFAGEVAFDKHFHIASTHSARCNFDNRNTLFLQMRSFSPRYIAPFGKALQQGSRTANEHGLLLGGTWSPLPKWQFVATADFFRFPTATFRASRASNGFETSVEAQRTAESGASLLMKYRFKVRQQDVPGHNKGLMENKGTHRLRFRYFYPKGLLSLTASADFAAVFRQTAAPSLGFMFSCRGNFKASERLSLNALAGVFRTNGSASAIYISEPQLPSSFTFNTFRHHGLRFVTTAKWKPCRAAELGLRYALIHYLNRSSISSGLQQIDSPTANDLSLYLKLNI